MDATQFLQAQLPFNGIQIISIQQVGEYFHVNTPKDVQEAELNRVGLIVVDSEEVTDDTKVWIVK